MGFKANLLRGIFPEILSPFFCGDLSRRMLHLEAVLAPSDGWTLIGSSFGGLMAVLYSRKYHNKVSRLILLAPALIWPHLHWESSWQLSIPTVIYHGSCDQIIPIDAVRNIARAHFLDLEFYCVDDDHGLRTTAKMIDWRNLVGG